MRLYSDKTEIPGFSLKGRTAQNIKHEDSNFFLGSLWLSNMCHAQKKSLILILQEKAR